MNKILTLLIIVCNSAPAASQRVSVLITFKLNKTKINDSTDLTFYVGYKNLTRDSVYVYDSLLNGNMYSPLSNINVEIEKLEEGNYRQFHFQSDQHIPYFINTDSLYKLNLIKIGPGQNKLLVVNLLSTFHELLKGKYRVRAHLLKIKTEKNKRSAMQYLTSKYFYFKIYKDFFIHL